MPRANHNMQRISLFVEMGDYAVLKRLSRETARPRAELFREAVRQYIRRELLKYSEEKRLGLRGSVEAVGRSDERGHGP